MAPLGCHLKVSKKTFLEEPSYVRDPTSKPPFVSEPVKNKRLRGKVRMRNEAVEGSPQHHL